MIGSDKDPRIKVLMHFDGNFDDARGHQVIPKNTFNYSFGQGVFGQCPESTGNVNLLVQNVFAERPLAFTASCFHKRKDTSYYKTQVGLCKSGSSWSGNEGLIIGLVPIYDNRVWYRPLGKYSSEIRLSSSGTSDLDVWHHYAVTYNNGTIKWYQDGNKIAETSISDLESTFAYNGHQLSVLTAYNCDEFVFADDLLIEGDTYEVPQEPYK